MKKLMLIAATVAMMAFPTMAFAAVDVGPGAGNPDTNPTGKCSPGQNKDTSVGGLKKCP
jgi:hypothetical protein